MTLLKDLKNYLANKHLGCYILSHYPLILISFWHDFIINLPGIVRVLPKNEPVWFFFSIGNFKTPKIAAQMKIQVDQITQSNPNFTLWFLNNSHEEHLYFNQVGLNSIFANHNSFLDVNRLKIMKFKKKYDAIYLARFTPVKRHYLARKIKSLLLIGSFKPSEAEYFKDSLNILSHAVHKYKVFGPYVTHYMNMAHVGLALSDFEGAMYASNEYLLSGLPVVSTPSKGGRDAFYRDPYVKIVEPDAEAVAEAVYQFIKHKPDPDYIRNETIKLMLQQRQNLINVIQKIYNEYGVNRDFELEWKKAFVNKLGLRSRVNFDVFLHRILREDFSFKVKHYG